jgi:hypothetical protein
MARHPSSISATETANARRNAAGGPARAWRWRPARAAAWGLLERHVAPGAAVAVIGAGNGHDLPLARLGRRAGRLDLLDLDEAALRGTRRRLRLAGVRASALVEDVTGGRAEAIVAHALNGRALASAPRVQGTPLSGAPYDVVVVDLMLSQLLYPALSDARLGRRATDAVLLAHGQGLTNMVIRRLAASAGIIVCLEDVLGWWDGHEQPFALQDVLDAPDPLELVARGSLPYGCDGRVALAAAGTQVLERAFWRWPFSPGTDYLVCATVASCRPPRRPRPM